MLYSKLGVDIFSTSELHSPNIKIKVRLFRAGLNCYMINDNCSVFSGFVDCSLYIRRIDVNDAHHKKRWGMLAYTPAEFKYLETVAKIFIIFARKNQFIQESFRNNAPVGRIAITMNTDSALTGSFSENQFSYRKFDLKRIRILRGGLPIIPFDAAYNRRLYVATMKLKIIYLLR